jgi:hypothetical protein
LKPSWSDEEVDFGDDQVRCKSFSTRFQTYGGKIITIPAEEDKKKFTQGYFKNRFPVPGKILNFYSTEYRDNPYKILKLSHEQVNLASNEEVMRANSILAHIIQAEAVYDKVLAISRGDNNTRLSYEELKVILLSGSDFFEKFSDEQKDQTKKGIIKEIKSYLYKDDSENKDDSQNKDSDKSIVNEFYQKIKDNEVVKIKDNEAVKGPKNVHLTETMKKTLETITGTSPGSSIRASLRRGGFGGVFAQLSQRFYWSSSEAK